jgi:hypothetical protein
MPMSSISASSGTVESEWRQMKPFFGGLRYKYKLFLYITEQTGRDRKERRGVLG